MNCKPCGKMFSGPASYQQHMESEKHKRKIATLIFFNSGNPEPPETVSTPTTSVRTCNKMHCPACDVSFDSLMQFQSHSLTLEHVSNVSKGHLNNAADDSNLETVSSSDSSDKIGDNSFTKNGTLAEDETDTILPPACGFEASQFGSFAECKTCNKQFSGPEPYKQHIESTVHKKKVEMANFTSGQTSHFTSDQQSPCQNIFNRFVCDPCKKVFSGQVPYQQHMISEVHRKKVKNMQLMEQLLGNIESASIMECDSYTGDQNATSNADVLKYVDKHRPWFCKICLIQCSGLVPFQQHIQGDTHFKNLRKIQPLKWNIESEVKPADISGAMPPTTITNEHTVVPTLLSENKIIQDMQTDLILPQALQNLVVVSSSDLNIKEFLPDEKIVFDNFGNEQQKDSIEDEKNLLVDFNFSNNEESRDTINKKSILQQDVSIQEVKVTTEDYKECKLCNVELMDMNAALSHYESIEHFQRKWPGNSNQHLTNLE